MIDLTEMVKLVLELVFLVIAIFAIPALKKHLGDAKMAEIQKWVVIAVKAAEMIYDGAGRGEEKKAYVLKFLNDRGYTINPDEIDAMIESAVLDLKNSLA